MPRSNTRQVEIGKRRLQLSNLDKVLYPGGKFTKAGVIDYYIRISEYLLPQTEKDVRDKWQLSKTDKNMRRVSTKRDDESVLSQRTMKEIAADADAQWESNRR